MTQSDLNELKRIISNTSVSENVLYDKLNYIINQSITTINNQQILNAKLDKIIDQLKIHNHPE